MSGTGPAGRNVSVGFVGVGVMGEPMCRHMAEKREAAGISEVVAFDFSAEPLARLAASGVRRAASLGALGDADQIHICLPGGHELEALCRGDGRLIDHVRPGQIVVDHGTSPVPLTRELAAAFAGRGAIYVDAPITRTRAAAQAGTLVVLYGGPADILERLRPQISCFAEEIAHCGDIGAGQVVKQMNNMVLFQTVVALAEALATARAAGVDGEVLFNALMQGSGDSFALRNHGMKALLPGDFPERAFATTYALKDLSYAMELASAHGLDLTQAAQTRALMERAIAEGNGAKYFPVVLETIAAGSSQG